MIFSDTSHFNLFYIACYLNYISLIISKCSKEPFSGLPTINYGSDAVVDTGRFGNRRLPRIDGTTLNNSIAFAQTLINHMRTLERNIANAGIELQAQSPAQKQFWDSYPSTDAFERSIGAIVATKASSYLVHQNCRRYAFD